MGDDSTSPVLEDAAEERRSIAPANSLVPVMEASQQDYGIEAKELPFQPKKQSRQ